MVTVSYESDVRAEKELLSTNFECQFKYAFTVVLITRAVFFLQECAQGEHELYCPASYKKTPLKSE